MPKYFVISGNHDQFVEWKKRNYPEMLLNHQIENLSDIVYVSSVHVLKGYSNPTGVFIGNWYRRKDIEDIFIQLRVSGMKDSIYQSLQRVVNERRGLSPE